MRYKIGLIREDRGGGGAVMEKSSLTMTSDVLQGSQFLGPQLSEV